MAEREIHGLGLGVYAVTVHDAPYIHVIDLNVRADAIHTPTIHAKCTIRVVQANSCPGFRAVAGSIPSRHLGKGPQRRAVTWPEVAKVPAIQRRFGAK